MPYWVKEVMDTVDDINEMYKLYVGDKPISHPPTPRMGATAAKGDDVSPGSSTLLESDTLDSTDTPDMSSIRRSRSKMPEGEPIVTHGWTFTYPCSFREVCVAIRESAFVKSDLPVIISLEVHADSEQQEIMVKIMKEEWKGILLEEAIEGCDPLFRVPKLEDLRRRILVKVKKVPKKITPLGHSLAAVTPAHVADDDTTDTDDDRSMIAFPNTTSSGQVNGANPDIQISPVPQFPICQALSDLAIYTFSEKFRGFDTPQAKKPPHIFSLSEDRIRDINEKHHADMFKHNKSHFMRVFPSGRRWDSSNPDPSLSWSKGVQMVAMNWQYLCEKMMLNEAMFAGEGGWVPKPSGYLSTDKDGATQDDAAPGGTLDLVITIFAGQNIPLEPSDDAPPCRGSGRSLRPVVKVDLAVERVEDGRKDGSMQGFVIKKSTRTGKSTDPRFGSRGTTLSYPTIHKVVEQLSFVRSETHHSGSLRLHLSQEIAPANPVVQVPYRGRRPPQGHASRMAVHPSRPPPPGIPLHHPP